MRRPAFLFITVLLTLCLTVGLALAQEIPPAGVAVVVNRDNTNVRLLPALGAEVIGFVNAGTTLQVQARSADNQWLRVDFTGEQGWIGAPVFTVISGDISTAPVADPRTIPYGGFESPRAGASSASSDHQGRVDDQGVRLRAGPSRAYPMLANVPRKSQFPILGRTRNSGWYQINWLGTLGWIVSDGVTLVGAWDRNTLPIDGIVADSPPLSSPTAEDYIDTLRLLRARVDFAQPSLDAVRTAWTTIATGGRVTCGNYPAQPTDYTVPLALLSAFDKVLVPLQTDFNAAMGNLRQVIQLLIDTCSHPQPAAGSVGQATVQTALNIINQTDAQFIQLRQRLDDLIPADLVPGPNACLFSYAKQADILPVIQQNQIYVDHFRERRNITGYCIDLAAGQSVTVVAQRLTGDVNFFVAISPFDNPTAFVATAQPGGDPFTTSVAASIASAGRYLIILNNITPTGVRVNGDITGDFAVLASTGGGVDTSHAIDILGFQTTTAFDVTHVVPSAPAPFVPTPGNPSFIVPTIVAPAGSTPGAVGTFCPGLNLTCTQMTQDQAQACLAAGNFTLDSNNNGVACDG